MPTEDLFGRDPDFYVDENGKLRSITKDAIVARIEEFMNKCHSKEDGRFCQGTDGKGSKTGKGGKDSTVSDVVKTRKNWSHKTRGLVAEDHTAYYGEKTGQRYTGYLTTEDGVPKGKKALGQIYDFKGDKSVEIKHFDSVNDAVKWIESGTKKLNK